MNPPGWIRNSYKTFLSMHHACNYLPVQCASVEDNNKTSLLHNKTSLLHARLQSAHT